MFFIAQYKTSSCICEVVCQPDWINVVLLADHFQILVVTVAETFILFVRIFSAMFILVLLHINVFADLNSISLHIALLADDSIAGGEERIVEKVAGADQMSSIWNHLHACDVLLPVDVQGEVEECSIFGFEQFGEIQSQTIERELNCTVNMSMIERQAWPFLEI